MPSFAAERFYSNLAEDQLRLFDTKSIVHDLVDSRVARIFESLQEFGQAVNSVPTCRRKLSELHIHHAIGEAHYRLFRLEGCLRDTLSECLRVAMLAFLSTTFQLPGTRIRYNSARTKLQGLCLAVEATTPRLQELMFWIIMMGAIAFFDREDAWLEMKWKSDLSSITTGLRWDQAEELLKQYIWIDRCNSDAGRILFKEMTLKVDQGAHHVCNISTLA